MTLLEVLAAIGLLLILAGVLVPILASTKAQAKESSDVNELHQLALAGVMYHDQYGEYPTGTAPLVASGLTPSSICSGMVDQYPNGLANVVDLQAQTHYGSGVNLQTPYRNSFIGPREFGLSMAQLRKELAGAQAIGWLVDLSSWKPTVTPGALPPGRYRRVLEDSAVVIRVMVPIPTVVNGVRTTAIYPFNYFGDSTN